MNTERINEPFVTFVGGRVKSLGRDRVGGRIVTFSGHQDPDREGEFFDAATDFWMSGNGERRPILYRHGADPIIKRRRFGEVMITKAADGLWCEGHLPARDEHSRKLLEMAEAGALNWSTGSVGHLVTRTPVGRSFHLDEWPIAECTLSPCGNVAEPRNVLTLKSFLMHDPDLPDFDDLLTPRQQELEQRVRAAYVKTLMIGHELRMEEIRRMYDK